MNTGKSCAFFGHRKVEDCEVANRLKTLVEKLIVEYDVREFLFGSKSEFDKLCLATVTSLKSKYPHVKRIAYTCKSEGCILESERKKWDDIFLKLYGANIPLELVDEEREFSNKQRAGRASYVERNYAMIDECDFCVFYFDENYLPPKRLHSSNSLNFYQPKSGTRIAYEYALKHKKTIFNVKKGN